MTFMSGLFPVILVIPKFQFPRKFCLCFCDHDAVEDESVMFEAVLN